jgi:phosphoribosylaminoimidazolecarboxamide formyltransferase/IMP cyclohydrolase
MEQGTQSAAGPGASLDGGVRVARALLSVSDKTGVVDFARGLSDLGIELVSTGGTARELAAAGLPVREVSDLTGFPEIMDGRVKTLHPKLHAGLLAVRDEPSHLQAAEEHDVELIDLACVNLYPFERVVGGRRVHDAEAIENIDIGGPTMIRAAAKNFTYVAPIVKPESYDAVLAELRESDRRLSPGTRENLAAEAFAYTARYDAAIARWFQEKREDFPPLMVRAFEKVMDLSYGENPHQRAAFYSRVGARIHVMSMVAQLGGKQLSFNNLLDLDAARLLLGELPRPACVIVKHNNPCGAALGETAVDAYRRAFAGDPLSAYGGVICVNQRIDRATAEAIAEQFAEVVFAPGYDDDALEVLSAKRNLRVLDNREPRAWRTSEQVVRQVVGGVLVQERDAALDEREDMRVVSRREPTETEWAEIQFSWTVCKHVRSNAIVISRERGTLGIGAGQMSRVDAVRLAVEKAPVGLEGSVMASDAFFPFADGPELALDAGVSAIIQPGGSVRDRDVIDVVDAAGATMVFTNRRHFRH